MSQRLVPSATPLARAVDLEGAWNAGDAELAARLHPRYAEALGRVPHGPSVFRGLPFALGSRPAARRWILLGGEVRIDLRTRSGSGSTDGSGAFDVATPPGPASHLVVAHFADSWRDAAGEREPGVPVGWMLPAGQPLAAYEILFADGHIRTITVRRRFEIADGIIDWGFLPFEAVGHRADETLDWRGPHQRQLPGRYAPAGNAAITTVRRPIADWRAGSLARLPRGVSSGRSLS